MSTVFVESSTFGFVDDEGDDICTPVKISIEHFDTTEKPMAKLQQGDSIILFPVDMLENFAEFYYGAGSCQFPKNR